MLGGLNFHKNFMFNTMILPLWNHSPNHQLIPIVKLQLPTKNGVAVDNNMSFHFKMVVNNSELYLPELAQMFRKPQHLGV